MLRCPATSALTIGSDASIIVNGICPKVDYLPVFERDSFLPSRKAI
jgi:hypothetical protein